MATTIGQLSAPFTAALQAAEAAAVFHTIIDFPKPVHGTRANVSLRGDIALEGVHFAYPGRPEVKILDGLHLRLPAGKVTAIVGPSGSGKSTIVGILERWYEFNGDPVTNPLVRSPVWPPHRIMPTHRKTRADGPVPPGSLLPTRRRLRLWRQARRH